LVEHWKGRKWLIPGSGRRPNPDQNRREKVGPERLAGPREIAAAEPFTPGRFIRPRVMLKPSSVGEVTSDLGPDAWTDSTATSS